MAKSADLLNGKLEMGYGKSGFWREKIDKISETKQDKVIVIHVVLNAYIKLRNGLLFGTKNGDLE